MKAHEIISLIENNLDFINSSQDKISVIIGLLETYEPAFDFN